MSCGRLSLLGELATRSTVSKVIVTGPGENGVTLKRRGWSRSPSTESLSLFYDSTTLNHDGTVTLTNCVRLRGNELTEEMVGKDGAVSTLAADTVKGDDRRQENVLGGMIHSGNSAKPIGASVAQVDLVTTAANRLQVTNVGNVDIIAAATVKNANTGQNNNSFSIEIADKTATETAGDKNDACRAGMTEKDPTNNTTAYQKWTFGVNYGANGALITALSRRALDGRLHLRGVPAGWARQHDDCHQQGDHPVGPAKGGRAGPDRYCEHINHHCQADVRARRPREHHHRHDAELRAHRHAVPAGVRGPC